MPISQFIYLSVRTNIYIYIYNISLGTTYLIFYWKFFAESMLKLYFEKKGEKIEVLKNYI